MNNKVIATIDISRPAGRKILRELQGKRVVTLEYPTNGNTDAANLNEPKTGYATGVQNDARPDSMPEGKTCSLEEAYEKGLDRLSAHFRMDMRKLKAKLG